MNSAKSIWLYDCYIQPEIKDDAPKLFDDITSKLNFWNINFEIRHVLDSETEFVLFCSPANTLHYRNNENLVIIPLNGEKKSEVKFNKKCLWFDGENKWELLFQFLQNLNLVISKRKSLDIKKKLDQGHELLESSWENTKISFPVLDLKERKKYLEEQILKKIKLKNFSFFKMPDLYLENLNNWDFILPLWDDADFLAVQGTVNKKNANLFLSFLKESWEQQLNLKELKDLTQELQLLEEVFKLSNLPMAVITSNEDLVIHNHNFIKLGLTPRQCLNYEHHSKIILHETNALKVSKISMNHENKMFFFCFQNIDLPSKANARSEELGIISSSIAHELNNPLAGIMAALSLLVLDDNWSNDALKDLEEMRRGSSRCKALVETFLGFSRMNPQYTLKGTFESSLDQALNLIRFRLVENNLKLSFQKDLSNSQKLINNSIFSMVIYLILGELITSFLHHLLVSKSGDQLKLLEGKFFVEKISQSEVFVIRVTTSFDFEENLRNSKLIKHLLDLESYKLSIDDRNIFLTN